MQTFAWDEIGTCPFTQYVEKLNRLTAEFWKKRGLQDFVYFEKRRSPLHNYTEEFYQP